MTSRTSYFVGICGASGSGKSTFVRQLVDRIGSDSVAVVTMDNYYKPITEQPKDSQGIENFDLLESFDIERFVDDVLTLKEGKSIALDQYTFNNALADKKTIHVIPAPVVIVEGLFVYAVSELVDLFDIKLFVDVHDHKRLIRRIKRDMVERNYGPEMVMHQWEHHVYPAYKTLIEPYKEQVDLIINNNISLHNSVEIIGGYIQNIALKGKAHKE